MGIGHAHSHSHDHGAGGHVHGGAERSESALKRAFAITFVFMAVEFVGGYWANSIALVSDAVHMLTDSGALMLSLFVVWISKRKAPRDYTYGLQRVEILGALLSGLLIWLLAGFLIFESFSRMENPPEVRGGILFWVASIGLLANLSSLFFLHRSAKENLNVRGAYLHVLTDSLGSVGAMIAGGVISLTGFHLIDPIVTIVLSLLMLWSSWRLVREAVLVLLERAPSHLKLEEIEMELSALPGVRAVHDLHVWTLSSGRVALSVHLVGASENSEAHAELLHEAAHRLEERFAITHTTIQVEPDGSKQELHCATDCEP